MIIIDKIPCKRTSYLFLFQKRRDLFFSTLFVRTLRVFVNVQVNKERITLSLEKIILLPHFVLSLSLFLFCCEVSITTDTLIASILFRREKPLVQPPLETSLELWYFHKFSQIGGLIENPETSSSTTVMIKHSVSPHIIRTYHVTHNRTPNDLRIFVLLLFYPDLSDSRSIRSFSDSSRFPSPVFSEILMTEILMIVSEMTTGHIVWRTEVLWTRCWGTRWVDFKTLSRKPKPRTTPGVTWKDVDGDERRSEIMYSLFDECLTETEDRLFETPSLCYAHETAEHICVCVYICVCAYDTRVQGFTRDFNLVHHRVLSLLDLRFRQKKMTHGGVHRKSPNFLSEGASSPCLRLGSHLTSTHV